MSERKILLALDGVSIASSKIHAKELLNLPKYKHTYTSTYINHLDPIRSYSIHKKDDEINFCLISYHFSLIIFYLVYHHHITACSFVLCLFVSECNVMFLWVRSVCVCVCVLNCIYVTSVSSISLSVMFTIYESGVVVVKSVCIYNF